MKFLSKFPQLHSNFSVILVPENDEDIWNIYTMLSAGDHVTAVTSRKVIVGNSNSTKSNQTRVTFNCTIQVESLDCDMKTGEIRIKGKNLIESDHIKLGQYHTLEVCKNIKTVIHKESWAKIYLSKLYDAINIDKKAETAVILMHEGLAHIFLLYNTLTKLKTKIEVYIAKKRKNYPQNYTKSINKFFDAIYDSFVKSINLANIGCVVVASPGCLKEQFIEFLNQKENKDIKAYKSKFICIKSSSGFKHSLNEIIQNEKALNQINNTQLKNDVEIMNNFTEILNRNSSQAFYGKNFVAKAITQGSVSMLLVSDSLFRTTDLGLRQEYIKLIDDASSSGAKIRIIATIQSKRLDELGGIAAILHYPMPEFEAQCVDEHLQNFSIFD